MQKLFLGNLPPECTETQLRALFQKCGVSVISLLVKPGGYGFVGCPDQNHADRAIDKINGCNFMGSQLRVEPSMPRRQFGRSCKVSIRSIPANVDWDEFGLLVERFGEIVSIEKGSSENLWAVVVYKQPEQPKDCVTQLNGFDFHGTALRAAFHVDRTRSSTAPAYYRRPPMPSFRSDVVGNAVFGSRSQEELGPKERADLSPSTFTNATICDMPMRMAVDARCVGAIIGQGGANIRQITRDSKARCVVDVNRGLRDGAGNLEKVINIYGLPENCSKACLKILEVVNREQAKEKSPAKEDHLITLKLRAHNDLMGRLIGKAGATIKRIMELTGSSIFVSNISELNVFNLERTVTIRADCIEDVGAAEEKISAKLRQCWEHDCINTPASMFGEDYPFMPVVAQNSMADPYAAAYNTSPSSGGSASSPYSNMSGGVESGLRESQQQQPVEVVSMLVPNVVVGALIGARGVHIRNVMRMTGAHVRIEAQLRTPTTEALQNDGGPGQHPANAGPGGPLAYRDQERLVTITGTEQQQHKAQFCIFQRVAEHCYHFFEEVRLNSEVKVPTGIVGRIIGKFGQNVRDLQRVTGAQIKIPNEYEGKKNESVVKISGNFNATQAVQNRIRQLSQQYVQQQLRDMSQRFGPGGDAPYHGPNIRVK